MWFLATFVCGCGGEEKAVLFASKCEYLFPFLMYFFIFSEIHNFFLERENWWDWLKRKSNLLGPAEIRLVNWLKEIFLGHCHVPSLRSLNSKCVNTNRKSFAYLFMLEQTTNALHVQMVSLINVKQTGQVVTGISGICLQKSLPLALFKTCLAENFNRIISRIISDLVLWLNSYIFLGSVISLKENSHELLISRDDRSNVISHGVQYYKLVHSANMANCKMYEFQFLKTS